jgi:hypothetical protein
MTPEPDQSSSASPANHGQAVWPWLLLPLVALTLYYVLYTVKNSPHDLPAHHAEASADGTPDEDTGSR